MLIIGSHVGFSKEKQLLGSVEESIKYKENTFMFYTGTPQSSERYPINDNLTDIAKKVMIDNNIDINNVIVHAPYIINLANKIDLNKFNFSVSFLEQELKRCEEIGINYMVLHPGNHIGQGIDVGILNIIDGLNKLLKNSKVTILLETMAGKGTEIGSNFNELKRIIDGVDNKNKIGLCLDTCHLHDSGYDIREFDKILDEIDAKVGLDLVKCLHINDSKNICGSKSDRHENIGYGYLGFDNLLQIIYNKRLDNIPKILETPYIDGHAPYKEEIEMIRAKAFNPNLK